MNPVIETIMNHRSIRRFKAESLTAEQVDILVKAAQMAPTSNGMQPYAIIGVTDKNKNKKIKSNYKYGLCRKKWPPPYFLR